MNHVRNDAITDRTSERGAVLIQVALGLMAMMAFSTFVLDYGVYWTSRRQSQNAADAGAIAGAVALAYDDPTDATGAVAQSALSNALDNPVWGQSPSVIKASDIQTPATGYVCPTNGTSQCVRVDVYRTAARGNALPIFFGQLVSLTSQDVQASAVAQVGSANASTCLMPWAVLDVDTGGNPYSVAADYGTEVTLKVGAGANTGGWFQATGIGGTGASNYRSAIEGCVNEEYGIGDVIPPENGNMSGPTMQGVTYVMNEDPNAYWCGPATSCTPPTTGPGACGNSQGCVEGSICPGAGLAVCPNGLSPRIVAVPTISPSVYYGNGNLQIDNIFGFFLVGDAGNGNNSTVTGVLYDYAGTVDGNKGTVSLANTFLKSVYLVR
jgi:Flp pilus assembly protein TadG